MQSLIFHSRPRSRLKPILGSLALLATAVGIGWAVPAAAADAPLGRFEALRAQDLRVAGVAYRLSVANKALCRNALAPQSGFVLHGLEQYAPAFRAEAARSFRFGRHFNVMAVVPGSPADKAGLAPDDQLVSVNGRELKPVAAAADLPPTRAFVEAADQIVGEEMRKGEIALRVTGPRGDRVVRFRADYGCPVNAELVSNDDVNAWADGKRVLVTAAILEQSRSDADLALVIAHELAHNLLHHGSATLLAEGPANAPAAAATMSAREEAADELGVALATAAAYDLGGAEAFLVRLMAPRGPVAATHPAIDRRLALLRAAIDAAGSGD